MEPEYTKSGILDLVAALNELRDSLVHLSMALKDQLADAPSPERDEVLLEVELQLARIRDGER
jgi:hypothetical protein